MTETADRPRRKRRDPDALSLPARVVKFLREVVVELRRVVWPTRTQVTTYTGVVLVFVVIMALLVAVIDLAAGKGVLVVFGN